MFVHPLQAALHSGAICMQACCSLLLADQLPWARLGRSFHGSRVCQAKHICQVHGSRMGLVTCSKCCLRFWELSNMSKVCGGACTA